MFGEPLLIYFTRMLEFQAPTHRVGACEFVSLAIGRDVSAALKKKNIFWGGWLLFWAYRYQIMQRMSLIIPTTGWHLTSHSKVSVLTAEAIGADLVHTWDGSLTISAINPRDRRTCPIATSVSSSTPSGLRIGGHI